jgi:pyridoxine 4-dehydrogenase
VSELAAAAGRIALGDNLTVCRMGFGAMWMSTANAEPCRALLRRAVELGIDLVDTADTYGDGASELMIAEALHPYPDGLVIATKGGQTVVDGEVVANGTPQHLREACEASLRRLRLETIDLYQLHMPDSEVPLEESLGALAELRAEGKVREIGASNLFRENLDRALDAAPLVSLQNQFNIENRNSEHEVAVCEQRGIAFIPYRPLAGGSLATNTQVALAWLLQRSPSMLPIPGTTSIEHLEQNVAAAQVHLSDDELARLAATENERPPSGGLT